MRVEFVRRQGIPVSERCRIRSLPIRPRQTADWETRPHPNGSLSALAWKQDAPPTPNGRQRVILEVEAGLTTPQVAFVHGELWHSEGAHLSLLQARDGRGRSVTEEFGNS